jgi:ribulose-phosphate 3-epimerase
MKNTTSMNNDSETNGIEVLPALMPKNLKDIEDTYSRYRNTQVEMIQLDLMDGEYVPEKTWPFNSKDQWNDFKQVRDKGFPGGNEIDYELDLMVLNPLADIDKYLSLKPTRIIFHASSLDQDELLAWIDSSQSVLSNVEIGLALHTDDKPADYKKLLKEVHYVQCMGIDKVGFQGESFSDKVIELISKVKEISNSLPIQIDGAVNPTNVEKLREAGASRLVSGSFLANTSDIRAAIEVLRN